MKFATALLKDRNGVIELDVPVTGSIDDPKFRIGPIVWQVIKNLLVKAVTAPFALLGSLFAGAEEAQFVDFAPGSATLDPASAGRLAALSKSLVEKPAIKLDVPIGALRGNRWAGAGGACLRSAARGCDDDCTCQWQQGRGTRPVVRLSRT